jgi:VCBS repeat-containing protein
VVNVCSAALTSGTRTVTITVNPVNDAPIAVANSYSTNEDTSLSVATLGVLANDTDVDLDTLTSVLVANVAHGSLTLNGNGSFSYLPALDYNGADSFTYKANDGILDSNIVTVSLTVTAVNDAPVAIDDSGTLAEAGPTQSFNVLANDTDVESDALVLTGVSVLPASGTVAIVGGQIAYTPAHLFSGSAAITYTVSDGHAGSDTGLLTVTVVRDTTAPAISSFVVTIGAGTIVSTVPIRVSWAATDLGGVGVRSYQVQVSRDGGTFTAYYAGTALSKTAFFAPNHSYRFQVRVSDLEGNLTGYLVAGARRPTIVQSRGTGVSYRPGAWSYVSSSAGSGQGYRYSSRLGASVSFVFTGREVVYVAPKNSRSGKAYIYIDGVRVATVDLRSATTRWGQQIFKKVFATSGRHTIKVVVATSGRRVNLDDFLVLK